MLVQNSYMIEEKTQNSRNLSLNLNLTNLTSSQASSEIDHDNIDENTKLIQIERQQIPDNLIKNGGYMNITNNNLCNSFIKSYQNNNSIIKNSDLSRDEDTDSDATNENPATNENNNEETSSSSDKKIIKMTKLGSKNVTLKRVSFGSDKGMVETLIFETPTPLTEFAEREFFPSTNPEVSNDVSLNDDSGIQMQEESRVRVTYSCLSKPQQISPPDNQFYFGDNYFNNNSLIDSFLLNSSVNETDSKMTAIPEYDRQISTDSGWDNPFRPDGDLSREADEIVNLIKGGKPITPTGELLLNGESQVDGQETNGNGLTVVDDDGATKLEASPLLNQANGTKSPQKGNGETAKEPQPKVSIQVVPGQQSASCVVIDEKKKKKRCCVIQ